MENFSQSKFQKFVACIPCYLQVVCFSKDDNKYRERKIDRKSNIKQGKQILVQLKADMARAKAFKSLQLEQISLYRDNTSRISSISSKEEDDNIKSIIDKDNSEENVQGN